MTHPEVSELTVLRESQELDENESSDSSIDIILTDRIASKVSTERF